MSIPESLTEDQLRAALARAEEDYVRVWTRHERSDVMMASETAGAKPSASTRGKLKAALKRLGVAEERARGFFKRFIIEGET